MKILEKMFNDERAQIYETKSSRTDPGRGTLRILAYLLTSPMTLKECLSSYYVRFIFYCKNMYQDILSKFIALAESIVAQRGLSALPSIDELQDKKKEVVAMVYFAKHLYRQKHLCPFTCPASSAHFEITLDPVYENDMWVKYNISEERCKRLFTSWKNNRVDTKGATVY